MSERQDLIEILEGQAVYINAARRAVPISVCKLLLKEEILAANVQALDLLRRGRGCQQCSAYQAQLSQAQLRLGTIRLLILEAQKRWPDGPSERLEGESLLRQIERLLDGDVEV